jgi:Ser/Thr protein kinase RdoA (MazF antagonist)
VIDLRAWPGLAVVGPVAGGHRSEVVEVRGDGRLVARRSRRSPEALAWELDLLELLADAGFTVPRTVPAADGRRTVDGVVVQTWLSGRPPVGDDWRLVERELRRLHGITWPQRPGFASVRDLLTAERGGDVDLTAMPPDDVARCRAGWRALPEAPGVLVHGDPCAANIRIDGGRVGLLDWDETRVDHPHLDLAEVPGALTGERLRVATAAIDAWEAANGWLVEPGYARGRLARLTARAAAGPTAR